MTEPGGRSEATLGGVPAPEWERQALTEGIVRLDGLLAAWGGLPEDLVRLRGPDLGELCRVERAFVEALRTHCLAWDPVLARLPAALPGRSFPVSELRTEHVVFGESIRELEGLLALVEADGHGGNRQALGQYWRLVWEALAVHLEDERAMLAVGRRR